jgi:glycosyltransferase involved in cell wall biosynthesis
MHAQIGVVVLNWNRMDLLRTTIYSLIYTSKIPLQIVVVDNNSSDGSQHWLKLFQANNPGQIELILLPDNLGGEAINLGVERLGQDLILVSENDIEFLPGWHEPMTAAFQAFDKLGQLSPFSPFPRKDIGEVWREKPTTGEDSYSEGKIYYASGNVTTSCMLRGELAREIQWRSRTDNTTGSNFRFPKDGHYSRAVKKKGYSVAWSGDYRVINWGHNINIWKTDPKYYVTNYEAKSNIGKEGMDAMLQESDFKLDDPG